MLVGLHPALSPQIVHILMRMGHGDTIVFADANFPSAAVAQSTCHPQPVEWTVDAITALGAVLGHFPIDLYDPEIPPVQGMAVVDMPGAIPEVVAEATPLFKAAGGFDVTLVERHAFYEAARSCFAVVRTAESRPYGNFILRKGVVSAG